jgi:hypothetical protein
MDDGGSFALPTAAGIGVSVRESSLSFDESRVPKLVEHGHDGTPVDW